MKLTGDFRSRAGDPPSGDRRLFCLSAGNLAAMYFGTFSTASVKMRKARVEHKWSGLAQRTDLTADMLSRQHRATSGLMHRDSIVLGGRPRRERDDVVGGIEEHLRDVITFADRHHLGSGSVSVSTVDAWFCPEARPQMTDQR
jgi:hypothetical protein